METTLPLNDQGKISEILDNIENYKSYYVGGTLCVDVHNTIMCFNLDETVSDFFTKDKRILSTKNVEKVFNLYRKYRGETKYYEREFKNSHIKYFN